MICESLLLVRIKLPYFKWKFVYRQIAHSMEKERNINNRAVDLFRRLQNSIPFRDSLEEAEVSLLSCEWNLVLVSLYSNERMKNQDCFIQIWDQLEKAGGIPVLPRYVSSSININTPEVCGIIIF
jgi:hypothetical protein